MNNSAHDGQQTAELIGYHLGLCDESERAQLEHAIGTGEALCKARAALTRVLAPLEADDVPEPPADLVRNILDRVGEIRGSLPFRPLASSEAEQAVSSTRFNLRELLSLAAAIAIFVGIFVPGYRTARLNSERIACANNFRQIGNGLAQYTDMFQAAIPVASTIPDGVSWAAYQPGARQVSNSKNSFMLVKRTFVPPAAFHCPGRQGDFSLYCPKPEELDDFPDPRNNSYSTQLLTPVWHQQQFQPMTPIAADFSPLLDQQRRLIEFGPIPLNSTSHANQGQNVVRKDISVIFSQTPSVGIDNDDIYRVIGVQQYTGLERPHLRSDAFLVP